MKIGILTAMDKEFDLVSRLFQGDIEHQPGGKACGHIGNHQVVLAKCGIGKVNAALSTAELTGQESADLIVSVGCAGSLSPTLLPESVVVGSRFCYHDVYCGPESSHSNYQGEPDFYLPSADVVALMKAVANTAFHLEPFVTGDLFVDSLRVAQDISRRFPDARIVDMESAAIAQVCHRQQVPFVGIRVVSDVPVMENNAKSYLEFWQRPTDWDALAARSFGLLKDTLEAL